MIVGAGVKTLQSGGTGGWMDGWMDKQGQTRRMRMEAEPGGLFRN